MKKNPEWYYQRQLAMAKSTIKTTLQYTTQAFRFIFADLAMIV